MDTDPMATGERSAPRPGGKAVAITALFYLACASIATWPRVLSFRSALPERYDSLQHLWIMRWYKTCLLEGRSVFHCPEIQHPIGAPLGNFSSLHLQALLYFPLSLIIPNDAVCYNLIWMFGLLITGLGTFLLVWHVLGDRACAAFGGMLAMLSAPMMIHAHAHLELIHVGWFPLFLVAWMRFVERPNRRRLVLASLGYVLVAMSAAYFMVYAIFPAALYAVWYSWQGGELRGMWPWLRQRTPWFLGFVALILPCLLVLFSSQFWALIHGFSLLRSREQFDSYGAPLWSYLTPSSLNLLGALLPIDPYKALGETAGERTSYLGVVTVALVAYAAIHRVAIRNASYLWSALVLVIALSLGAYWQVGTRKVLLPSGWLWEYFPVYRTTRVPARFNLFAGVLAGVLAAAGLRHLLSRFSRPATRGAVFVILIAIAVADLAMVPFWQEAIPAMPGCYAFLRQRDPKATLLEIPHLGSGGSILNASCTYWQSLHRLTTSGGYSGQPNLVEDARIGHNSPFHAARLADPDYLEDPARMNFDMTTHVDFKDFVWLYLTVNRFDYVVLHQWAGAVPEFAVRLDRLKALLQECKIYEDDATIVYARSLLRPPLQSVHICLEEWIERSQWAGRWNCRLPESARVVVYNPDPDRGLTLVLDAASPTLEQAIRLRVGTDDLARWDVVPGDYQNCASSPFRLPSGLQELSLEAESSSQDLRPSRDGTRRSVKPHRFRIARVSLYDAPEMTAAAAREPAVQPSRKR